MNRAALNCQDALTILFEDPDLHSAAETRRARAHAAVCPRCAGALDDPDAAERVLETLARHRPNPSMILRVTLAALAAVQLVVASPWLFGASFIPDQNVALAHLTRDGALGIVIATAGFLVAWRPRYALAATVLGSIVFAAQFATGLVDDRSRTVSVPFELVHLLVFAILAVMAFTTGSRGRPSPALERDSGVLHPL